MNDAQASPAPPAKGSQARLVVLLMILVVAAAGLLYDYLVARRAVAKARTTLESALNGDLKDPDGDGAFSMDDVHKLVGREPDEVLPIDSGKQEIYYWRSGMPLRKYRLIVAYWGTQTPLLYSISVNEDMKPDQLPPKGNLPVRDLTEKEKAEFVPRQPTGVGPGAGGPPSRGGKKGAGDGKRSGRPGKGRGKGSGKMSATAPPTGDADDTADKSGTPDTKSDTAKPPLEGQPKTDKPAEKKPVSDDTSAKVEPKKDAKPTPPAKPDAPPAKKDGDGTDPKK